MRIPFRILSKIGADAGACSVVTDREVYDSQITMTGEEQLLLEEHFLGDIHVGNVKSNPVASAKTFLLHPIGARIKLNLVYPKPSKGELRLYLRERSYKPHEGHIWFIYRKGADLYLGSMTQERWEAL